MGLRKHGIHMEQLKTNLTDEQKDYATFLPAISGFYATFIGQQRYKHYVDPHRIPSHFTHSVESLNWLNVNEGIFTYKWSLYSAGHAYLDTTKHIPKEDMIRNRDRNNSWLLGDSGGFQIGKGVWEGDWKDPNCPKAKFKREQVLAWMDAYMDYGMILDIPAWVCRTPKGQIATGITSYTDAVNATRINNDYFMQNRNGNCKFLNVLQGENHTDAEDWYQRMKDYCDPKKYQYGHFNGWSMGGQNMCSVSLILKRIVALKFDNLLEEGIHDVMHFLGTSKLEWAVLLTDIQRAVRKHYNKNFNITFDCASPFLATANGQIYTNVETRNKRKWTYRMVPGIDNKQYAHDTRLFKDVGLQDGTFKVFEDSPITEHLKVNDICIYADGDLNKVGKEGRTSWDSFSYAIQMAHNVWSHINAVQTANIQYDNGTIPRMLVDDSIDHVYFKDLVDEIFSLSDKDKAFKIIEQHDRFLTKIIGTRGQTGKREINTSTYFQKLFDSHHNVNKEPKKKKKLDNNVYDSLFDED